ncbi:SRPBCC domain-containing protein [Gordonia sp. NPDC058843]|uniref:SRPBCC domain-containing protein n=1 Tax=Gordonia sp. NPDC058843 TaxID=3346648 RepID=UPI003698090E
MPGEREIGESPRADGGSVIPLRRPPIRQSTTVRSDLDHVFTTFVRTIGVWWPLQPMSIGGSRARTVTIDEYAGGRVYETWDDGTTAEWGRLAVWEPPNRFVMSWLNTPAPTEVELAFTSLGPALTRVSVEHRGWEHLSEDQLREDCAAPGGYSSGAYYGGWAAALAASVAAIESTLP